MENYADVLESYVIVEEGLDFETKFSLIGAAAVAAVLGSNILISKYRDFHKRQQSEREKKKKEKELEEHSAQYRKYLEYLKEVFKKLPKELVNKEKLLRKKEINTLKLILSKINKMVTKYGVGVALIDDGYDLENFLDCNGFYIFDDFSVDLLSSDDREEAEKYASENNTGFDAWYRTKECSAFYEEISKLYKEISTKVKDAKLQCVTNIHEDGCKWESFVFASLVPSKGFIQEAINYGYCTFEEFTNRQ